MPSVSSAHILSPAGMSLGAKSVSLFYMLPPICAVMILLTPMHCRRRFSTSQKQTTQMAGVGGQSISSVAQQCLANRWQVLFSSPLCIPFRPHSLVRD